jgi:hypothetical protein
MSAISIPEPSIEQRVALFAALNTANILSLKTMLAENPRLVFSTRHNELGFRGLTPLEAIATPYSPRGFTPLETTNLIAVIFDTLQTFDLQTNRSWYIPDAITRAIEIDNYMFIEEMINLKYPFSARQIMSFHTQNAYKCIRVFIRRKININYFSNGHGGLYYAALGNKDETVEILKMLLANGYNVKEGIHPLIGAYNNEKALTFLLQEFPEDINVRCPRGWTPLHYAVDWVRMDKSMKYIEILINFPGCDLTAKTNDGQTPYSMLTSQLISIRKHHSYSKTPTKNLIKNTLLPIWIKFLTASKDINQRDENGLTPLHFALKNEFIEMVDILISQPEIDLTAETSDYDTPLSIVTNIMLDFKETPSYKNPIQKNTFEKLWMPVYKILSKANDERPRSSSESSESNFEDVD